MSYTIHGSGGAAGLVIGPAFVRHTQLQAEIDHADEPTEQVLARFAVAQAGVAANMNMLAEREQAAGHEDLALLFEFLSMLAEDPTFSEAVAMRVGAGTPLIAAITESAAHMAGQLAELDSAYQRERAADMTALGRAMIDELLGNQPPSSPPGGSILITEDLSPAELVGLPKALAGFVTASGSPTGHTAIFARARGIPAVVGAGNQVLAIENGTMLTLDGAAGIVTILPDQAEQEAFQARAAAYRALARAPFAPIFLTDGRRVRLWANIAGPDEITLALAAGAEGVGLFRTEFLFLGRATLPDEQEQYAIYREALEALDGRPLTVRLLDIGADKRAPSIEQAQEPNPALGERGMRLLMRRPDLLITQLRALLRAGTHGDLRILLPMVTTPDDLIWARSQLDATVAELQTEQADARADLSLGAMIETPAAAVTVDLLAPYADFFSIGTNDLAQYTLAADRESNTLTARYPGDSMAVLRLVAIAAEAAALAGRPIEVCGELAGIPATAGHLVSLGIDTLSMAAAAIPGVRAGLVK
jgi:phosphoenolpyruvate-protein phosphotransferase